MSKILKYKKQTFKILLLLFSILSVFLLDSFLLPQQEKHDTIVSYSNINISSRGARSPYYSSSSHTKMRFTRYHTKNGFSFSIEKRAIEYDFVILKHSPIFKIVTGVISDKEDRSSNLVSGFKNFFLVLTLIFYFSLVTSLLLLKYTYELTENRMYNIILSNSFILFLYVAFIIIYN